MKNKILIFLMFIGCYCFSAKADTAIGDTIRYDYSGNNLFYLVTSVTEGERTVRLVTETDYDGGYYTAANKP